MGRLMTLPIKKSSSCIKANSNGRQNVGHHLDLCIDPMNPEQHSTRPFNIVLETISSNAANDDDSVALGIERLNAYEN